VAGGSSSIPDARLRKCTLYPSRLLLIVISKNYKFQIIFFLHG
jgi:hypothetical protein